MNFRGLIVFLVLVPAIVRAETEITAPESESERQESTSEQEWEAKDIIPPGGITVSTQPMTPIALLPDKKPHDQAMVELGIAQDLWKNGKAEAASDVALQAYDDLMSLRLARRNKKQRQQLRLERRQAATVYTDSSIAYIEEYVKKHGGSVHAVEEGRARLGDLRDVAMNYPELNKKLNQALEVYAVAPSTPTVIQSTPTIVSSSTVPTPKN
jgi:hypothetical protein